jgi:hypothetical protein
MLRNVPLIKAESQQQISRLEQQNSHWQLSFLLTLETSQISRLRLIIEFLVWFNWDSLRFFSPNCLHDNKYTSIINSVLSLNVTVVMSICIWFQRKIKILAFHTHICQSSSTFCDKHCVYHSLVALQGTRFRDMFACLFANTVK